MSRRRSVDRRRPERGGRSSPRHRDSSSGRRPRRRLSSSSRSSSNDSRSSSPRYSRSKQTISNKIRGKYFDDRDNPKPSNCIGIFGLSLKTEEKDLYRVFQKYGDIKDVQLVLDNYTGRSRGFGFVYFEDIDSAKEAKETAHGSEIDGRTIRVDYSITRKAHTPTPGVYLGRKTDKQSGYGYNDKERDRYRRSSPDNISRSSNGRSRSRSYNRSKILLME